MKKLSKFIVTALLLILGTVSVSAQKVGDTFVVDNIKYQVYRNINEVSVQPNTDTPYSGDITIPKQVTYNGKTFNVATIGMSAFKNCKSLTSVVIPNGVRDIMNFAFDGCTSLKSITIPNSVTSINLFAFRLCNFTTVNIPASVFSLSPLSFDSCAALKSITVDEKNGFLTSRDGVVFTKNMKKMILYPMGKDDKSYEIPATVTEIDGSAFNSTPHLTSVTIPASVTKIGESAFNKCINLATITSHIENNISKVLGRRVFFNADAPIKKLFVPVGKVEEYKNSEWISYTSSIYEIGTVTSAAIGTLFVNNDLQYIVRTDKKPFEVAVTKRSDNSYSGDITIPAEVTYDGVAYRVTEINELAFSRMKDLTSVTINAPITKIGKSAFAECPSLTSINLPSTLTDLEASVFYKCSKLTSVTIDAPLTKIPDYTFHLCSSLSSLKIPNSVTEIGENAFAKCSSLKSINLPTSLQIIGTGAFASCTSLNNILHLPASLTTIKRYSFDSCTSLFYIDIPASVTSIQNFAFQDCTNLTYINSHIATDEAIKNSLESIKNVFKFTDSNTVPPNNRTLFVPKGTMETYKNSNWKAFTTTLSENETDGLYSSFENNGINYEIISKKPNEVRVRSGRSNNYYTGDVTIPEFVINNGNIYTVTAIKTTTFKGERNLRSVTIPNTVTSIGERAFETCNYLSSVNLPNSIKSIGEGAFTDCHNLKKITIPTSINKIEDRTFYRCTDLDVIDIPNSVTEIGAGAFDGCSELAKVTIPFSVKAIGEGAFRGCKPLAKIVSFINANEDEVLKGIVDNTFSGIDVEASKRTLIVPTSSFAAYKASSNWKKYTTNIEAMDKVGDVFVENGVKYKITALEPVATLEVLQNSPNYAGDITILEIVSHNYSNFTVNSIAMNGFMNCNQLTSLKLPNSITKIGNQAFVNCVALTSVNIPTSLETIGQLFFANCNSLKSITIPASVKEIKFGAFVSCRSLESITIPAAVAKIGNDVFEGCVSLKEISVDENSESFSSKDGVLFNKDKTTLIRYPQANPIVSYKNPNSVKVFAPKSFKDCLSLTTMSIQPVVTTIGDGAFENCVKLSSLTSHIAKDEDKVLGKDVFRGCTAPTKTLYVPKGLLGRYKASNWKDFTTDHIVEIETTEVKTIRTTDGKSALTLLSNVVESGQSIEVSLNLSGTQLAGSMLTVVNSNGELLNQLRPSSTAFSLQTPTAKGIYIVLLQLVSGEREVVKLIVR